MAAGKKKPVVKNTDTPGIVRSLRDNAEEQLARSPKRSPDVKGQTAEELIHELQVHQIELEIQAEELRRSHLALEESRDKYLDLYEFAPVGYLTLSKKALITEANLTAATLLGVDRRRLISDRLRRFIAPEDLECWDHYFVSVLHTDERTTCDLQFLKGDNARFHARLESILKKRENGEYEIRLAISNITAQKQAEEIIYQLNEERKIIIDNVPAMIWYKDTRNNYIRVNPAAARTYGLPTGAIEGKSAYDLFPDDAESYYRNDLEVIRSGKPKFGIVHPMKTYGGKNLWIRTDKIPLKNQQGTTTGVLVFSVDITDIKHAEEELVSRSNRIRAANVELTAVGDKLRANEAELTDSLAEKEVLLSEIHHRVKNNLAAFISLLSLDGTYEETPAGERLKKDLQNRARSMALIHETLYMTQKFSGVDMGVYLTALTEQVAATYSTRSVMTSVRAEGVTLDLARATPCGLIVNELITNSFKYAFPASFDCGVTRKEPCTIRVSMTGKDGMYQLVVQDNGIGLPPGFDLAKTKTLGLKLVNFLARHQMRADIEVRGENGTEFIFRLNK